MRELFERYEQRDAAEVLDAKLPAPIAYESHRDFVRSVLRAEVDLRALGPDFVPSAQEPADGPSARYRTQLNSEGSPTNTVAAGYVWTPGTELSRERPRTGDGVGVAVRGVV